jgi:hypothetical protein
MRVAFFVVLRRTGPQWDDTHLQVDTIDPWTIRLDGRNR